METIRKNKFLLEELVKRDFKKKYKRTVLGFLWSMFSPLLMLSVMSIVFSQLFGKSIEYYVVYILAGQIVFAYFSEATNAGMVSLLDNASIFSKISVPKYLFVLSRNISALINFGFTIFIFFAFVFGYGIKPSLTMLFIFYPVVCLILFNYGVGLVLSALYIFYRDMQYLYSLLLQVVMYGSAIFYSIDILSNDLQTIFYFNPLFAYITFIRECVVYGKTPELLLWVLCLFYATTAFFIGVYFYKHYNYKFIYYI